MNTLVVDDEKFVRWFFQRSLQKLGHSVASASRMSEAKTLLNQSKFDTVVVDLMIPDGDGIELVRELLDNHYEPQQVIVCSAYITSDIYDQLNNMGIVILRKPFRLKEMHQVFSRN